MGACERIVHPLDRRRLPLDMTAHLFLGHAPLDLLNESLADVRLAGEAREQGRTVLGPTPVPRAHVRHAAHLKHIAHTGFDENKNSGREDSGKESSGGHHLVPAGMQGLGRTSGYQPRLASSSTALPLSTLARL